MAHCGGFGIAAGILGAVMVFKMIRMVVWRRRFMHGGGCGGHGRSWRGRGPWGRGPGGSWWLRGIFMKLDTTPGQEKEIRSAIEDFQREASAAKDGLKGAREHLARAFGKDELDEGAIVEARATAEDATSKVKDAFAAAIRRVHAVLDNKQRERFAEILARGPSFRGGWGGPYRAAP